MVAVIEKGKEFILEDHIPSLLEFLSNLDLSKNESLQLKSNSNGNDSLPANTPKKNASARKENGSGTKAHKAENSLISSVVKILKNVFEISLYENEIKMHFFALLFA